MKINLLARWAAVFSMTAFLGAASNATEYAAEESYEVASLIINLSQSITRDLKPPATGAERIVTKALVSDEGTNRVYYIEGKDVYHTGRVLSTYWLRLIKPLNLGTMNASVSISDHHDGHGRAVSDETTRLLGPLLNGLYDIALFNLDHRRVVIETITEPSSEPFTIEIVGLNDICTHDELNRFRLTLTRHIERNRAWYETVIEHPYGWSDVYPTPIPDETLPLPLPLPVYPAPVPVP